MQFYNSKLYFSYSHFPLDMKISQKLVGDGHPTFLRVFVNISLPSSWCICVVIWKTRVLTELCLMKSDGIICSKAN